MQITSFFLYSCPYTYPFPLGIYIHVVCYVFVGIHVLFNTFDSLFIGRLPIPTPLGIYIHVVCYVFVGILHVLFNTFWTYKHSLILSIYLFI